MQHNFNVAVAEKFGVNAAIILQHIAFWCDKNRADNCNCRGGTAYTQISKKGMSDYFSYLTERQISYAIDKLIDSGVLIKFQDNSNDRRNMYAVTDIGYDLLNGYKTDTNKTYVSSQQNVAMKHTKCSDDIYISNNKYNCKDKSKDIKKDIQSVIDSVDDDVLKEQLNEFVLMRKRIRKHLTPHALELILKKLYKLTSDRKERVEIVEQSIRNGWQDVYPLKRDSVINTSAKASTNNPFILAAMEEGGRQ